MTRRILILFAGLAVIPGMGAAQAVVHVDASGLVAPRPLNEQTRKAAIEDYLQSWQTMSEALAQNRPDLLDAGFVGTARDRLANTIREQATQGISTQYRDRSHNIQILFYSPEGLSIELADTAEYDVQVIDHGKAVTTQPQRTRYVVVMTPSEVRWRVRVLQAGPE
jgi:hypothetical protein